MRSPVSCSLPFAGVYLATAFVAVLLSAPPSFANELQALKARQERVISLAEHLVACTVSIEAVGSGSGVVIDKDGLVLTAGHVVSEPGTEVTITFADGRRVKGETLGADRRRDAAMVRIKEKGDWKFVELGQSDSTELGTWCIATGHPGGFDRDRPPPVRVGRLLSKGRFLESDCIVVGGDSGGPLFDFEGRVIGIHSNISSATEENRHVPIDAFRRSWDRMLAGESWGRLTGIGSARPDPDRPFLGVELDRQATTEGAVVSRVVEDSAAAKAKLRERDIIKRVGDTAVARADDLVDYISGRKAGETLSLQVVRGDKELVVEAVLGKYRDLFGRGRRPRESDDGDRDDDDDDGDERRRRGRREPSPESEERLEELVAEVEDQRPTAGLYERDHRSLLPPFHQAIAKARRSTVAFLRDKRRVALGTVITSDGYILTKASEVAEGVRCRLPDGELVETKHIAADVDHDLALLQVERTDLQPIQWNEPIDSPVGSFLATALHRPEQVLPGCMSVPPRSLRDQDASHPLLGVILRQTPEQSVRIDQIVDDSAAADAGLQVGDTVRKIDDEDVTSVVGLVETIGKRNPGDVVRLRIERGGEEKAVRATLKSRSVNELRDERLRRVNRMSSRLSKRRGGFASVFQHDTELRPEDCGGPVVEVSSGRVIGVNIARAGRISTFAVPVAPLLRFLEENLPSPSRTDSLRRALEAVAVEMSSEQQAAAAAEARLERLVKQLDATKSLLQRVRTREASAQNVLDGLRDALSAAEGSTEAKGAVESSAVPAANTLSRSNASVSRLRELVGYLSADALAGRDSGEAGLEVAAEYIAEQLQAHGIEPAGDSGTFFHHFTVPGGAQFLGAPGVSVTLRDGHTVRWEAGADVEAFGFPSTLTAFPENAPVVFVGFGIRTEKTDEENGLTYDDYESVDVKGKVLVILRYHPRRDQEEDRFGRRGSHHAAFVTKLRKAKEQGAVGVIFVTAPGREEDDLYGIRHRIAPRQATLPAVFARRQVVAELFRAAGLDLEALHKSIEADHEPQSRDLPNVTVSFRTVERHLRLRNVVGRLPGSDPQLSGESIVIGGHYDHIGRFGGQVAGANLGEIHNGADDNASGTAGVIEVARLLAAGARPKRTILFMGFSGEEIGLHGSREWVRDQRAFRCSDELAVYEKAEDDEVRETWPAGSDLHSLGGRAGGRIEVRRVGGAKGWVDSETLELVDGPPALHRVAAMVNLDMIGRAGKDGGVTILGATSGRGFPEFIETLAKEIDVPVQVPRANGVSGGSDHANFQRAEVPVLFFHTGITSTYNKPEDDLETLNLEAQAKICDLIAETVRRLGDREVRPEFDPASLQRSRGPRGPRLGVQIDQAYDGEGVRIDEIVPSSAAATAELKAGDVILEFAGQKTENFQALVGAIRQHAKGKVKIRFLRDGKEQTVEAEFPKR